jgi:DNA gyrase/topoisomerase IV subunit A
MMGHVDAEINAVKRHLEELECLGIVVDNLEEFIHLIRISKDPKEACARFQKRLEIGYVKAQYLLNLPLAKVTSFDAVKLAIEKEDFQKRLAFLYKLKPSGMEAISFKSKGIPR